MPRELEKEIERTFEAAEIDDQRAVGLACGFAAERSLAVGPRACIIIGRNHIVSPSRARCRLLMRP